MWNHQPICQFSKRIPLANWCFMEEVLLTREDLQRIHSNNWVLSKQHTKDYIVKTFTANNTRYPFPLHMLQFPSITTCFVNSKRWKKKELKAIKRYCKCWIVLRILIIRSQRLVKTFIKFLKTPLNSLIVESLTSKCQLITH